MSSKFIAVFFCLPLTFIFYLTPPTYGANTTYYVSSSEGNDNNNNGLSEGAPFATIARVNALNLEPGDQVLFKCGDIWRAESLVITESGATGNPITFGSYPASCANKPIIAGAQPISGWGCPRGQYLCG